MCGHCCTPPCNARLICSFIPFLSMKGRLSNYLNNTIVMYDSSRNAALIIPASPALSVIKPFSLLPPPPLRETLPAKLPVTIHGKLLRDSYARSVTATNVSRAHLHARLAGMAVLGGSRYELPPPRTVTKHKSVGSPCCGGAWPTCKCSRYDPR